MNSFDHSKILAKMAENFRNPVLIESSDHIILYVNKIMQETFGNLVGHHRNFLFQNDVTEASLCEDDVFHLNEGVSEVVIADVAYKVICTKIEDETGDSYNVVTLEDISLFKALQSRLQENLETLKRDAGIAKQIQGSVLPSNGEYWNAIRLNAVYMPAEDLSGDFFDIVSVGADKTLLYIADVSGHGIQASLLTMFIRENVRAALRAEDCTTDGILRNLLSTFQLLDVPARFYLSILLCLYNQKTGTLSIANAGHNCFPLVLRSNGRIEEITVSGMPISKISLPESYEEESIVVHVGDRILLYTDGIVEEYSKMKKKSFGTEGVRRVASEYIALPGDELARKIIEGSNEYMLISAKDDRTIVVADFL
ncbi:MAG: serine/threonine-protein phosphatase [Clostridiales Family XIII bacterium]|jgi:sigma-B regulation protein RsbU (phosphoserine phosphatase)|nr:serine/threonine-protein phosphatase [Clostridiales Family XIII bacterium]